MNSQNWSDEQKQEFSNAYTTYIDAFSQDNTGRFSTDAFGTILDNQGSFTSDIPATKYYDKSGKSIDSATYATLKDRQKKKYATFNANE